MNRRKLLKTGTASTVALTTTALSGCLGLLDSDETDDNNGSTKNNVGPEDSEGIPAYNWTEGESYKYKTTIDGQSAEMTWTVVEADDTNVTMKIRQEGGKNDSDKDVEVEISGTNENIYRLVVREESVRPLINPMRRHLRFVVDRDLSVDDSYTYEAKDDLDFDTWNVEVLAEETVNGISCHKLGLTIPDNEKYEDYTNTLFIEQENNYPFAISEDINNSGGTIKTELMEATRP